MDGDRQLLTRIKRDVLFGHDIAPPTVDVSKCTGCGTCVKVCTGLVFELRERKSHVVFEQGCYACGHCWAVCPEEAVTQNDVVTATSLRPGPVPAVAPEALQLQIRERRSTRIFTEEPVSEEQIRTIVEAARYIPTGTNRQDVSYIVLSRQEEISALRAMVEGFLDRMTKALQNGAMALLFRLRMGRLAVDVMRYYAAGYGLYAGMTIEEKQRRAYFPLPFGPVVIITHAHSFDPVAQSNCAVALYNCSLMAHSLGLASCFLGFVPVAANMDKKVRRWLDIPKGNQCYSAMVLGHPGIRYRRLVERKNPEIEWR